VQPSVLEKNKIPQGGGCQTTGNQAKLGKREVHGFLVDGDGTLRFQNRLCVPDIAELKEQILTEAHNTRYSIHPGGTKMYRDLKQYFWWDNMKREIAKYVDRCSTCQRVKAEHQCPVGELRTLEIPTWKWDSISMDFIMGLPLLASKKNAIWVIVDKLTKSAHFLLMHDTWGIERLAQLFVKEIVRLHDIPKDIVSD